MALKAQPCPQLYFERYALQQPLSQQPIEIFNYKLNLNKQLKNTLDADINFDALTISNLAHY